MNIPYRYQTKPCSNNSSLRIDLLSLNEKTLAPTSENLLSQDKDLQYEAYNSILASTKEEVDWAYEVWEQLKLDLTHSDSHRGSRAVQFLSGLAKGSLLSIWKISLAGTEQKEMVIKSLVDRFINYVHKKTTP